MIVGKKPHIYIQFPLFVFTQGYHELRVGGMLTP